MGYSRRVKINERVLPHHPVCPLLSFFLSDSVVSPHRTYLALPSHEVVFFKLFELAGHLHVEVEHLEGAVNLGEQKLSIARVQTLT